MCKVPVVTKLPTFMESPYCSEELSCEPDDASELAKLLLKVSEGYGLLYEAQRNAVMKQYLEEKAKFHMAVVEAYRQVV